VNSKVGKSYRDLIAWQKGVDLVEMVYTATQKWPKEEIYGLTHQVRRASVSVPSNIAEGQGRASSKEFSHHLSIARGSLLETETQLLLGQRLGYLPIEATNNLLALADEVGRLITGLSKSLQIK
jgi:four helix bundle protein